MLHREDAADEHGDVADVHLAVAVEVGLGRELGGLVAAHDQVDEHGDIGHAQHTVTAHVARQRGVGVHLNDIAEESSPIVVETIVGQCAFGHMQRTEFGVIRITLIGVLMDRYLQRIGDISVNVVLHRATDERFLADNKGRIGDCGAGHG